MPEETVKYKWLWVDGDYLITYLWFRGPEVVQQFWLELVGFISEFQATRVAIAWDSGKDRRRQLQPAYKRNRLVPEEWRELKPQLKDTLVSSLKRLPVYQGAVDGLEADDLIWCWQLGKTGVIISGDRDLWQCLDRPGVAVWSPRQKHCVTQKDVDKEFGDVRAMKIQKCLVGDKSDGVKGVEGVGPIRARELWQKYSKTLEMLVPASAAALTLPSDDRWLQKVYEAREIVQLNWRILNIAALVNEVDIEKADKLISSPFKLFDADAVRFYAASQGWFNVLKEWSLVVKAFQHIC